MLFGLFCPSFGQMIKKEENLSLLDLSALPQVEWPSQLFPPFPFPFPVSVETSSVWSSVSQSNVQNHRKCGGLKARGKWRNTVGFLRMTFLSILAIRWWTLFRKSGWSPMSHKHELLNMIKLISRYPHRHGVPRGSYPVPHSALGTSVIYWIRCLSCFHAPSFQKSSIFKKPLVLLFLLLVKPHSTFQPPKKTNSYLWRITPPTCEGKTRYVFGTMHEPPEELLPHLPGNIIKALKVNHKWRILHVLVY